MAEIKQQEKAVDPEGRETVAVMSLDSMGATGAVVPSGWMYKSFHIGRWATPYYASPMTQLLLVSFVCFLCPGMYNALNGLGGGGISNADASNKAAIALNSTFAVVGFFSGSIINKLGLTLCLIIGGSGYSIYVGALLSWKLHENLGFVIFGGAFLGFSAALLWTAQGTIMMSYPEERRKGRFIAIFWGIFNLGAVIGSLVPLGQNSANKSNAVGNGTYIAFIVLTLLGAVVGGTLISPLKVVRADGTHVIAMKHPSWKSEIVGMWEVLKAHSYIVALFPMFFASNWFYTYQFNAVNLAYFNIRTRSLNNVVYWSAQIIGAFAFGYGLDYPGIRRVTRARIGTGALFLLTIGIWAGGYVFQKGYTRESVTSGLTPKKDWTDSGYIGPMFLYLFYGFFDAAWQTTAYWIMGCLSNSSRKSAYFAGFYKGIQSAGGAISPILDSKLDPYMTEFAACWALLLGGLVIAAPVIWFKVKDHVEVEEDLKFSDEQLEDVIAPEMIAAEHHHQSRGSTEPNIV